MRAADINQKLNLVQKYALLIAAAKDEEPIRGNLWFQKEMYWLSKNVPELASDLGYEADLMGPMSEALDWNLDQLKSIGLLRGRDSQFVLTEPGRECAGLMLREFGEDLWSTISELKGLLNDLPKEELLAFTYFLNPDITLESKELEPLLPKRQEIAARLFHKGKVGLEKGALIAGVPIREFASYIRAKGIPLYSE